MANTKQHYPSSVGVKPITVNGLALSNAQGHCSKYNIHGKGSTSAWMEPINLGSTPTAGKPPPGGPKGGNHPTVRNVKGG